MSMKIESQSLKNTQRDQQHKTKPHDFLFSNEIPHHHAQNCLSFMHFMKEKETQRYFKSHLIDT